MTTLVLNTINVEYDGFLLTDSFNGRRFVRFSFAGSTADIDEAVSRLVDWRRGPCGEGPPP